MNDLFNRIFLKFCLHAAVTLATYLVWVFLAMNIGWNSPDDTLWILIFIANCTTLILSKLNRILERLPQDNEPRRPG